MGLERCAVLTSAARAIAAVVLAVALLAACSDSGTTDVAGGSPTASSTSTPTTIGTFGVERRTETFVDESRPTVDGAGDEVAPTRTLVTEIYVPDGTGPFPLIVHAHGMDGHPRKFRQLLAHWAEHGYVVAAPAFPLTNDEIDERVVGDFVNQPADVSFVIDEVLALAADPDSPLSGIVDESTIGVSGLSLGGATTYGVGLHSCCLDERVDAIQVFDGIRLGFPDGDYVERTVPLLIVHGTADHVFAIETARESFAAAQSPAFLVTLADGTHAAPFEDTESPHDAAVLDITTRFWRAFLSDDADAEARLTVSPDPAVAQSESR
ncbi:MAG TPA: dienelactone hydrolase family protein [Acidimicrobiia bacterium]|nr:dienelactone hydrolase family protein [Acidimicrobiia bacterium]